MDYILEIIAIVISSFAVAVTLWINKKNREHAEKMIELNKQHEREMLEISFLLPKVVEIIEGINKCEKGKIDNISGTSLQDLLNGISDFLELKREPIISLGFENNFNDFFTKFKSENKLGLNESRDSFKNLRAKLNDKYLQLLRER